MRQSRRKSNSELYIIACLLRGLVENFIHFAFALRDSFVRDGTQSFPGRCVLPNTTRWIYAVEGSRSRTHTGGEHANSTQKRGIGTFFLHVIHEPNAGLLLVAVSGGMWMRCPDAADFSERIKHLSPSAHLLLWLTG